MALMLDGKMSTVADIIQQDSGCLEVSEAEAISIDGKLALADRDCRLKLAQFVVNQGLEDVLGAAGNLLRLDRIVANEAMERWHEFHTLSLLYSDAYYRSLNDRYEKKLQHYEGMAKAAWEALIDTGIACTLDPVPRATIAATDLVPGMMEAAGAYFISIQWLNLNGQRGALSDTRMVHAGIGMGIQITAGERPAGISDYDVFAGTEPERLYKQNEQPVSANDAFVVSSILLTSDESSAWSEPVDFVLRRKRRLLRG